MHLHAYLSQSNSLLIWKPSIYYSNTCCCVAHYIFVVNETSLSLLHWTIYSWQKAVNILVHFFGPLFIFIYLVVHKPDHHSLHSHRSCVCVFKCGSVTEIPTLSVPLTSIVHTTLADPLWHFYPPSHVPITWYERFLTPSMLIIIYIYIFIINLAIFLIV